MENLETLEDEFHVNVSEPVDLGELCKPDSKGSEFEVCLPADQQEEDYFDNEDVFKQLNQEVIDLEDDDSGGEDLTPFERIARRMEAVHADGGVKKKVIKVGSGEVIQPGFTATVHYNGYLEYCDEPYDSTRLRNRPLKLRLGDGQVIDGLAIAVSTMRKGELSQFLVQPQYAFGAMGVPPRIPPNASILFEVELLNISDTPVTADLDTWTAEDRKAATFEEILEVANAHRKAGNDQYNDKNVSKAISHYLKAVRLLENARLANQSEEDEMNRILLKLYLNLALCNVKRSEPVRAISYCTKALAIDDKNVKAMFRRGQALQQQGEFEQSQNWLTKALKLSPNNHAIVNELAKLHKARTKFEQMDRNMWSGLFSSKGANKGTDSSKPKEVKTTKTGDKQKECPPESQEIFKKKLRAFAEDEALVEMPFALDTLTPGESEYIQQAAVEMGLQVRTLQQNSDKYLKITKPKPEGE